MRILPNYTVPAFIADAKKILDRNMPLEDQQAEIADRMKVLTKRDDLTKFGYQIGPADAANNVYLLWLEQPHMILMLAQFDPRYRSPVHEHGDFWVIGCGYRGVDRWDIYERVDDGKKPGHAEVKLVDEVALGPQDVVWVPPPPRSIHSHNNPGDTLAIELQFSAAKPTPPENRLIYNLEDNTSFRSWWALSDIYKGSEFPPKPVQFTAGLRRAAERMFCPICKVLESGVMGARPFPAT